MKSVENYAGRPTDPEASQRYSRLDQLNPGWWETAARLARTGRNTLPGIRPRGGIIELAWWGETVLVAPGHRTMTVLDVPGGIGAGADEDAAAGSAVDDSVGAAANDPAGTGTAPEGAAPRRISYQEGLAILGLLMYAAGHDALPPATELVSAEHLTGGTTFFRGPHVMASVLVAERFAADGAGMLAAARVLGGEEADFGEFGARFTLFPGIDWIVALWAVDEEFPAAARFLFDRSLERIYELDVIWALGNVVARRLIAAADVADPDAGANRAASRNHR
ncbi:MAG: DUF3786 domain-containing protein [Deltaproteobacteria bacterium]|nr:DUF3786 domain-containing protein [Candidatus Anaeroferrophillacea bacterium]